MSMIERVARAICKTDYDGRDFDDLGDDLQDVYREYARAAIVAMRKPTDQMVRAAHKAVNEDFA